jgi:hypothetical protein
MAFTPDPNLFNRSFGGGLQNAKSLLGMIEERQKKSKLQEIAASLPQNDPYEVAGSKLIELGMVQPGLSSINIPYNRENQRLQREFQNQQAQSTADYRQENLRLQGQRLGHTQSNTDALLQLKLQQAKREEEQNRINNSLNERKVKVTEDALTNKSRKTPLSSAAQKQLFEADDARLATQNVIGTLDTLLDLNDNAYSGPQAGLRGYASSLWGNDSGEATERMSNLTASMALDQLKAVFGGMPTEGERKILIDVQGSVNQSPEVRKKIFQRAKAAMMRRLDFNKRKSEALRNDTYFQTGIDFNSMPSLDSYLNQIIAQDQQKEQTALPAEQRTPIKQLRQRDGNGLSPEVNAALAKHLKNQGQ